MREASKLLAFGFLALTAAACGPAGKAGFEASLKERAAKDFNCAKPIEVAPAPNSEMRGDVPTTMEASGCSKKGVYVLKGNDWEMAPP